jgi:alpha-ketoglutarate-dependent taurine dioxygenase
VIWDNASLLHRRRSWIPRYARTLWRITVKEPAPAGRAREVLAPTFATGAM